ncbi:MAG: anthrone oxygenase family protein [Pseudomonadota bacterium]
MSQLVKPLAFISLLLTGALFGFFYAWVCSTMWGLDAADPRVAIAAMQAMNASVRNLVFAPAFFGTPVVLLITTVILWRTSRGAALPYFAAAALSVIVLGFFLTMTVNVPMNEALGQLIVPQDKAAAQAIWDAYSPDWQVWNQVRTAACGLALLLVGFGITRLDESG